MRGCLLVVGQGGAAPLKQGLCRGGWLLAVGNVLLLVCTLRRPLHTLLAFAATCTCTCTSRIATSWPLMKCLAHFTPSALGRRKLPAVRTHEA